MLLIKRMIRTEKIIMDNIQIKSVMGHVEVIINGTFSFSADSEQEN